MARVSAFDMVSVQEARDTILAAASPLPREIVPLVEATGRTLAVDVDASDNLPDMPRSSMDGYAVQAGDSTPRLRVIEEVTAGRLATTRVTPGTAVHIMTGGSMPDGADAVVMVEEADEAEGVVTLRKRPRPGENVHPVGMDLASGQRVLSAGTVIGPAEMGLLATVGLADVPVIRHPRVAVLATGDELVEPWESPPPGSIRDSNRYALMTAARLAGADVVWHGHGVDDEAQLEALILRALEDADVLLTSGGVSMGTRDLIKPILGRVARIAFGRVSFKPGKPLTFAVADRGQLIFGLPGFPVSSLVTFEVFVRPALLKLGGRRMVERPRVNVELEHDVRPDPVRPEYMRATVRWEGGRFLGATTGLQSSSRLMSIAGANALFELDPAPDALKTGSTVKAFLLADL